MRLFYYTIIFINLFVFKSSFAQFSEITFPNEIKLDQINKEKLNGISCQLIKRKNYPKKLYKSTAFFIRKNCLLTSAHNLKKIKNHNIETIGLFPSRKEQHKPYGSIIFNIDNNNYYRALSRNLWSFKWRKRPRDMALIYIHDSIIETNKQLQQLSYLPILENPDEINKGDTIYCAGFPGTDIYNGYIVMTMVSSTIKSIRNNHFSHRLNTFRGNSGSPIMVKQNGQFYVIGINSIHNYGTWLNAKKQKLIKEWIKELEDLNQ